MSWLSFDYFYNFFITSIKKINTMSLFEKKPLIEKEEKKENDVLENEILEKEFYEESDLFILIDKSVNKIISKKESEQLFKQDVYCTSWFTPNWWRLIIFDLEKNSIIPEVRFVDWYWKDWKGWGFSVWLLIIWVILAGIMYYSFTYESSWKTINNEVINEKKDNSKEIIDFIKTTWPVNTPIIKNTGLEDLKTTWPVNTPIIKNTGLEDLKIKELDRLKNDLYFCKKENINISQKQSLLKDDISFYKWQNETLRKDNDILFIDLTKSQNEKRVLLSTQKELTNKEKTFLTIWQGLFKSCQKKKTDKCLKFFSNQFLESIESEKKEYIEPLKKDIIINNK